MLTSPDAGHGNYTYDANGNTISRYGNTLGWDFENRWTSYPVAGATFKYDPFGRRIQKSYTRGTTIYECDGDNITEEFDATGTVTARNTQSLGIDEPLARTYGGATYFYQADGLGSITSSTTTSGDLQVIGVYDSFGQGGTYGTKPLSY